MFQPFVPAFIRGLHIFVLFCLGFAFIYGISGYGAQGDEAVQRIWMQGILLYGTLIGCYLFLLWLARRIRNRMHGSR